MRSSRLIEGFTGKYPLTGPSLWILSIQYFIVQVVAAMTWKTHYSLLSNTISDLGNTACGLYGSRQVCSPLHGLMNASFILLGVTMYFGAILIYQKFRKNPSVALGFNFMALAGVGTIIVGLFPENTVSGLHTLGATLPFFIGNVGMVILGLSLAIPKPLRYYTLFSGAISLIALALLLTNHYLGLGIGGMERITAYPQTIWLIIFGIYISRNYIQKHPVRHS
jgi:hypothetical membrane protein